MYVRISAWSCLDSSVIVQAAVAWDGPMDPDAPLENFGRIVSTPAPDALTSVAGALALVRDELDRLIRELN